MVWRERLAQVEPVTHELPELPGWPNRRSRRAPWRRSGATGPRSSRGCRPCAERESLAAQDPASLHEVDAAQTARLVAEQSLVRAEAALGESTVMRNAAAASERAATEDEAQVNRAWREASTELERLREAYEDEDRVRGDLERRVRDAERLLREGHRRDPQEGDDRDDTRSSRSRSARSSCSAGSRSSAA